MLVLCLLMPIQYLFQILLLILQGGRKVGQVGIMLGLAAVGGSAVGAILSARKANNPFKPISGPSPQSNENTIRLDQASKLQKKLMRLLHDDRDTANRLISQVKMKKS